MNRKSINWRAALIAVLAVLFTFAVSSIAQASSGSGPDKSVTVTLVNTATAFFIFALGVWITYLTRGGFLSLGFILITVGITIGWVAKLGVEFLADSGMLVTSYDAVGIAEVVGGLILVAGFYLLSEKLRA